MRATTYRSFLFPVLGVATGLLSALLPSTANAAVCPAPTLTQCKTPAFYDTPCGAEQKSPTSACSTLIQNDFQANYGSWPQVQRNVPSTNTSVPTVVDHRQSNIAYTNLVPTFTTYTNWMTRLRAANFSNTALGIPWLDNGPVVGSCEEYAYDSSYDYSKFDQQASQFGPDYRAIYDFAFMPGGISTRVLKDSNGEAIGMPVWPGENQPPNVVVNLPKNAFFEAYEVLGPKPPSYYAAAGIGDYTPWNVEEFPESAGLAAGQHYWPKQDWAWHRQMNDRIAHTGVADDVLFKFDEKKEAFRALLRKREAFYRAALTERDPVCGPSQPFCGRQSAVDLIVTDQEIFHALAEARAMGCLSMEPNNPCDWSPRLFVKMLSDQATRRRENDFQTCVSYTGNNFSVAAFADKTSPHKFRDFLGRLATQTASLQFPIDPVTHKPMLGDSAADNGLFGSSDINAKWRYDASWKVLNFNKTTPLCQAQLEVKGNLHVDGNVYSATKEVFDADVRGFTDSSGGHGVVTIKVGGEQIYDKHLNDTFNHTFNIVEHPNFEKSYKVPGPAVSFFGFTIGINAGFSAKMGVNADLALFAGRGCDSADNVDLASVTGSVTPYVDASVFAELAGGIPHVLEVGIKGTLVLVEASLPISAHAKLRINRGPNFVAVFADLGMSVKLKLQTLNGNISAFASFLDGLKHAEKVLFEWNGYTTEATLFEISKDNISLVAAQIALPSS